MLDDLSPKCSLLGVRHLNGRQLDLADVGVLLGGGAGRRRTVATVTSSASTRLVRSRMMRGAG